MTFGDKPYAILRTPLSLWSHLVPLYHGNMLSVILFSIQLSA